VPSLKVDVRIRLKVGVKFWGMILRLRLRLGLRVWLSFTNFMSMIGFS
jgi:hypothetical protein